MNLDATADDPVRFLATAASLRSLARRLIRDEHAAEDIVQEALVRSLSSGPRVSEDRLAWLRGVVRLQAKNLARRDQNRRHREASSQADRQAPSPEEIAEKVEAIEVLSGQLRALEDPFRSTIVRLYIDGLSPAEIARQDSVAESTVRWRHSVGLARLRDHLDRRFNGRRAAWCVLLGRLDHATRGSLAATLATVPAIVYWCFAITTLVVLLAWIPYRVTRTPQAVAARTSPAAEAGGSSPQLSLLFDPYDSQGRSDQERTPVAGGEDLPKSEYSKAAFTLRTIGRDGHPLAGVRVVATAGEQSLVHVTADDGVATFEFAQQDGDPSAASLAITATGLLSVGIDHACGVELFAGQQRNLGDIILDQTGVVEGIVRGPDGSPRGGTRVLATLPGHPNIDRVLGAFGYASGAFAADTTDSQGAFRLEHVRAGPVEIYAEADDAVCTPERLVLAPNSVVSDVEIFLSSIPAVNLISGRVIDALERPVAGAEVTYVDEGHSVDFPIGTTATEASGYRPVHLTTTDDAGCFSVRVHASKTYDFYASAEGRALGTSSAYGVVPGSNDLLLKLSCRTVLVQLNFPPREQRQACNLQVWNVSRSRMFSEVSCASSSTELQAPQEPFILMCSSKGYSDVVLGPLKPALGSPSVHASFVRAPQIRGRVTANGLPVAGSLIRVHLPRPYSDGYEMRYQQAASDADGRYSVSVPTVLQGQRAPIVVLGPGGVAPRKIPLQSLGAGVDGVDFELQPRGRVEVVVLGDSIADVSGRLVTLWPLGSQWWGQHVEALWTPTNYRAPQQSLTDASGTAVFSGLRSMRYCVMLDRVNASYYMEAEDPSSRARVYECEVTPGGTSRVAIKLQDAVPTSFEVALAVNGLPAEGWIGQLLRHAECNESRLPWGSASDSQGRLLLDAPHIGEWVLRLSPPKDDACIGWIDVPVMVDGQEGLRSVRLEAGTIHGTYGSTSGVTLTFTTKALDGLRCARKVTTGPGGTFVATFVLCGRVQITSGQSSETHSNDATSTLDVSPGEPLEVRIP